MICLKVPEFRYLHQVACSQIPLRWAVGLLSSFVAVTALCSAIAACWVRRPQLDGGGVQVIEPRATEKVVEKRTYDSLLEYCTHSYASNLFRSTDSKPRRS